MEGMRKMAGKRQLLPLYSSSESVIKGLESGAVWSMIKTTKRQRLGAFILGKKIGLLLTRFEIRNPRKMRASFSCSSSSAKSLGSFSTTRFSDSFIFGRRISFHIFKKNHLDFCQKKIICGSVRMASTFKPEQARVPPAIPLPTPPITKFKIGLCQLSVTADKERNIVHARTAIMEAAEKGAKLVLLPEIWNSPYSNDSFPVYAEDIEAGRDASPSTAMLSEVARTLKITIVGGSIPERCGDKLYNTCCVFDTYGELKAKHRKIHLFDIDIPGQITFKESKTLTAGATPTIVDTEVGRIGIGICYDIRFQELATLYAARGAHLICYPGAFNMTTGPLHWELLQRARAADNQLYVATCSPARDVGSGYVAWGHSTLVGPFGEVLATTEHDEAVIISEIDYSQLELRRTNLPLQNQRRGDLYQLVDVQRLNDELVN